MYLDKDEDGVFSNNYTNLVSGTSESEVTYPLPSNPVTNATAQGVLACPTNSNVGLSVAGTCNGTWDGYTRVRGRAVVVFSGGEIGQPGLYDSSIPAQYQTGLYSYKDSSGVVQYYVVLSDYDGNPLPADAALVITGCKSFSGVIGDRVEPIKISMPTSCSDADFMVKVNAVSGVIESHYRVSY